MRHGPVHLTAALLLFLGGIPVARGDDKPTSKDLGKIQPPGGVPLDFGRPGTPIKVDALKQATKRLESAPAEDLDKWVAELERITDKKLEGDLAKQACRTYFVSRMSVAFEVLKWNAKAADDLFRRAQTMPASEAKAWKEAFEAVLKKEIGQTATTNLAGGPGYTVPLVLIPVDALHEGPKYSAERGKKYRARLKQLTAEDITLWKDRADQFGGTELDAAVNIILLDGYFDEEQFRREKFKVAIGARKEPPDPAAADFPKETFTVKDPGATVWAVTFDGKGKVTVARGGREVIEGTYKVTKGEVEFTDEKGPFAGTGDAKTGTYKWRLEGGKLTFTKVKDESEGRARVLTAGAWERKDE